MDTLKVFYSIRVISSLLIISVMLAGCGGGGSDTSTGGDIEIGLINVAGNWSGTVHSDSANINGTISLSLSQTEDNIVSGSASIIFPPPYVSCLSNASVSGNVFRDLVTLTITAGNQTSVIASGSGTATQISGAYFTAAVNESMGCSQDTGTFEVMRE